MARIIIVDDDTEIRVILQIMLEVEGHSVEVFENGNDAIYHQLSNPADIFITDLSMPGIDGLEILKKVKEFTPKTKIIVMSGSCKVNKKFSFENIKKSGADEFLKKPFIKKDLINVIKKLLI